MEYGRLGGSGLVVSRVGVGCNAFGTRIDAERVRTIVDAALDCGVNLFDTADVYGLGASEALLGEALGARRDEVVIATKFGMDMKGANGPDWRARGARGYVRTAVEASLSRLRTEWIDLYQLHEPDPGTPIEETLTALSELVKEGKVRYVGSSNLAAWQVAEADGVARSRGLERFVSAQNAYSLYDRSADAELVPACEHLNISLLPYYPLASGLLTGKYHRGVPAPAGSRLAVQRTKLAQADFDRVEALSAYAGERGLTLIEVAVGGLLAKSVVGSVIAGVSRAEQVRANVDAAGWQPTADELDKLDELTSAFGRRPG